MAERLAGYWLAAQFSRKADEFKPQVVLSVMLPDSFMTAAALYARRRSLPLVLLCHDDYIDFVPRTYELQLGQIYRQAAARLCVSGPMEEEFFTRYGVHGEVLPPIPSGPAAPVRQQKDGEQLIVGFAGSIGYGYEGAILGLADALAKEGGRLIIASPTPRALMTSIWRHPAVLDLGALPHDAVRPAFFQAGVNVLAVVQSFTPAELPAFRLNFPSKLTEYTTFGLPILMVAPECAGAAIWLKKHPEAGILVQSHACEDLRAAVQRLNNAFERRRLAEGLKVAAAEFDPEVLNQQFEHALFRACRVAREL